jgi:hypothetical protein
MQEALLFFATLRLCVKTFLPFHKIVMQYWPTRTASILEFTEH